MDRFEYSEMKLLPREFYVMKSYNVKLYNGDEKTPFENGEITLTSQRLLWSGVNNLNKLQYNLSIWLKYIIYIEEEKASFAFLKSKRLILFLMEIPKGSINGPMSESIYNFIKLSFADKIDMEFASTLSQTIREKQWETKENVTPKQAQLPTALIKSRTGIVGIERSIQEKHKADDESISLAFQDLSKLMGMAKDMVNISKTISTKLKDKHGDITDDETIRFKSYLLSLGIEDPVTRGAFRSDAEYYQKLSKEITQILEQPVKEIGGIMALTDAYCRVNRARGLSLLSVEDFLSGCTMLETSKMPIVLRHFDSGVKVLQLTSQNDDTIAQDTRNILLERANINSEELARLLGISVILAKERLLTTEKYGRACRDDSIEGLRFYPNKFLEDS